MTTHDENDSLLVSVDLNAWRVPPPIAIDHAELLGRALAPATIPPRASRLGWIIAAIVVINAAIATLIVLLARPEPAPTIGLPAGGDPRVHELLQRLDQEQREIERKLAEIREMQALIIELDKKIRSYEQADRDRKPPPPPPPPRVPERSPPPPRKTSAPEPPEPPVDPTAPVVDSLQRGAISSAMSSIKGLVLSCGEHWSATGTIRARVRVAPNGTVAEVSVDAGQNTGVSRCVEDVIAHVRFMRTRQGGSFSYPFVIQDQSP